MYPEGQYHVSAQIINWKTTSWSKKKFLWKLQFENFQPLFTRCKIDDWIEQRTYWNVSLKYTIQTLIWCKCMFTRKNTKNSEWYGCSKTWNVMLLKKVQKLLIRYGELQRTSGLKAFFERLGKRGVSRKIKPFVRDR